MKRVCIIGNSHLAALKLAWQQRTDLINGSFVPMFFGAHRGLLRNLHADGSTISSHDPTTRRFLALTSGLANPVLDLVEFDAIVIHALVNPTWALRRTIALARHQAGNGLRISSSLAREICLVEFRRSILAHVLGVVREACNASPRACNASLLVTPQPLPSMAILVDPDVGRNYQHRPCLDSYTGPNLHDLFEETIRTTATESGAIYLPQSAATVDNVYFTKKDFSTGSIRLNESMSEPHPDNDHAHMNQAYGELLIDDIFCALGVRGMNGASAEEVC